VRARVRQAFKIVVCSLSLAPKVNSVLANGKSFAATQLCLAVKSFSGLSLG